MRSPLRWSGIDTATEAACGHSVVAMLSTADSETISPAILAKRLARPLMVMKPAASIATMSPVSCQPSGERFEHAGIFGPEVAEHHVRSAHREASAFLDAGDRIERGFPSAATGGRRCRGGWPSACSSPAPARSR